MLLDKMWSWSSAWILAALMAAAWVWPKLVAGLDVHPVLGYVEARSGVAMFDPQLRYVIGGVVAVSALALLIPRTRLVGAVGALLVSLFYFGLHLSPWLGSDVPQYGPLMQALEAGRTAEQIAALGLRTDRAAHLSLVTFNIVLAAMVLTFEVKFRRGKAEPKVVPKVAFG
jgi:hypothetical protein